MCFTLFAPSYLYVVFAPVPSTAVLVLLSKSGVGVLVSFFLQAEDGIRDHCVTGVQTCALPICVRRHLAYERRGLGVCYRRDGGTVRPAGGAAGRGEGTVRSGFSAWRRRGRRPARCRRT